MNSPLHIPKPVLTWVLRHFVGSTPITKHSISDELALHEGGSIIVPKHIIAVSALVRDSKSDVLLVKTHNRSDTWELPGGQVEEGEPLDEAVCREVLEETGITIRPMGITGVYYNVSMTILSVVFVGAYVNGTIKIQSEEIKESRFVTLTEESIGEYITRPHMRSRTLDAIKNKSNVPYEGWEADPYKLISRLES